MGYNIGEVTGYGGGPSDWTLTVDLDDPSVTSVTGDFDLVDLISGDSDGEADTYTASDFSANFGTYTDNFVLNGDGSFSFDIDRQAVFQSGADQTVTFTITGETGTQSDDDSVSVTFLICVAKHTTVKTVLGEVPVECLAAGDWVPTRDSGDQQIRWIGSRTLSEADLDASPNFRPIRIMKGALGCGRPENDLLVSPQHRVFISDWRAQLFFGRESVLVPAKGLVNGTTIFVDKSQDSIEYYHILFDKHEVIATEGALTESFHPADYTLGAVDHDTRSELFMLFPDLQKDQSTFGPTRHYVTKMWEAGLLPFYEEAA